MLYKVIFDKAQCYDIYIYYLNYIFLHINELNRICEIQTMHNNEALAIFNKSGEARLD